MGATITSLFVMGLLTALAIFGGIVIFANPTKKKKAHHHSH